jgi:DNA-directed RNA polymerase subunit RPC12/RpoP
MLTAKDRMIIEIMAKFTDELRPIIDEKGVSYPDAERLFDLDRESTVEKLEELVKEGVMTKNQIDSLITCPNCGSHLMLAKLSCPNCGSRIITKGRALRHSCGYIGLEYDFSEGKCPVCDKQGGYQDLGVQYRCESCGNVFRDPRISFLCLNCGKESEDISTVIKPLFSYKLKKSKSKLDKLENMLKKSYNVNMPGSIRGLSGVVHQFNCVLHDKNGRLTVVDIAARDLYVGEEEAFRFALKVMDTAPNRAVFIAIPRISADARDLLRQNRVEVVEAEDLDKAIDLVVDLLMGS